MEALTAVSVAALTIYDMIKQMASELGMNPGSITTGVSASVSTETPVPPEETMTTEDALFMLQDPDVLSRSRAKVEETLKEYGVDLTEPRIAEILNGLE